MKKQPSKKSSPSRGELQKQLKRKNAAFKRSRLELKLESEQHAREAQCKVTLPSGEEKIQIK